jgi:hypothetical protein
MALAGDAHAPPIRRSPITAAKGMFRATSSSRIASTIEATRSTVSGFECRTSRGRKNAEAIAPSVGTSVNHDARSMVMP